MTPNYITMVGWLGSFFLIACGVPQLFKTVKTKKVDDISILFLLSWFFGEVFSLLFVLIRAPEVPLIANYSWNLLITGTLLVFYIVYRR